MSATLVVDILVQHDVQYAIVGGVAVAARGYSRFTRDYDFLTTESAILNRSFWSDLEPLASIDVRRGDFDDPLRGLVRIKFASGEAVDVVVAKYRWQQDVIARSELMDLGAFTVPVPRTPDLILLKLFAGGYIDVSDIRALLDQPNREEIIADVDRNIGALPEDAQKLWATLRAA